MIRPYRNIDRFTVGTVGLPGERTFFLQFRSGHLLTSMSLEKSQVAALAERLRFMLKEIGESDISLRNPTLHRDTLPLENPILDEFRIGSIAIFFDVTTEEIQIDLRELSQQGSDADFDEAESEGSDIEVIRLFLTDEQVLTFCDRAELVIAAGRKPCPFCGLPISADGHICARANGYRR